MPRRREDALACEFDPSRPDPVNWSSVNDLRRGLRAARKFPLGGVFEAFELKMHFAPIWATRAVIATRRFRDEVVHRARPGHKEAPSFGRTSEGSSLRGVRTVLTRSSDGMPEPRT